MTQKGQRIAAKLDGQRFGRLVVLWRGPNKVEPSGATRSAWQCRCDCGTGIVVTGHALSKGHTRSCGCLTKEKPIKHGMARKPIYRVWWMMRQRCENPNFTSFASYGGRGITVCDRWQEFSNFYADMGDPTPGMTLERIDNDKGYNPDNVRWASRLEQAQNRRTNTLLSHAGQTLTLAEWGRVTGLGKQIVTKRFKSGWSPERILTEPVAPRSPRTSRKE